MALASSNRQPILRRQTVQLIVYTIVLIIFWLTSASPVHAAANLTIAPITWNIIGLDSNNVSVGPDTFPVGARVCNTGDATATNVVSNFVWDSTNTNINLVGGISTLSIASLAPGACFDFYYNVQVTRTPAAYNTTRRYHITATADGLGTVSTPTPRELFVEHLISQNRNATTNVQYGSSVATLTSVPAGGSMNLVVGNTYVIRLFASTATQGYEQIESFLTLSNTIFQILAVDTTYSAVSGGGATPIDKLYGDACNWENNPNSPNYRACLGVGKNGGSVVVTYTVKIIGGGGSTVTLNSLIYDFSGSSFHYNSDFSTSARFANIIDPTVAGISKQFTPSSITVGGTSVLTFTLTNASAVALSGYNFIDNLPSGVTIATTPGVSTSGCGSPTVTANAGASTITVSNATVGGNSSCTISVNVTSSTANTYNNTSDHLFIDTADTTHFATAILTVSSTPPPPACTPGQAMASWTFNTGSSATAPSPSSGTASTSVGSGLTPSIQNDTNSGGTGSWASDNISTSTTLNTANNEYFEFALNTTGFQSVTLTFYTKRTSQGAQNLQLYYGTSATPPGTAANVFSGITTSFAQYTATISSGLNANGTTYFRLYAYNAGQDNNGHYVYLDDVTFTGCGIPQQPTLGKAFSPATIAAGGTSTLTFTLTNPNPGIALTGAAFTDTLPSGMTVASTPAASTTCVGATWNPTSGSSTLNFSGGTIPMGGSCTAQVNVTTSVLGPSTNISNYISTTQTGTNSGTGGSASATLTVLAPPQIRKLFSPNPILAGGVSTLTFTITNPNQNSTISGVAFTDTLPTSPAAMVVANPPNASSTCGGTLTANAGAGSISLAGGSIAGGGSCTISVNVTAPNTGSYNNSVTVSHAVNGAPVNGNTANDTLTVNPASPGIAVLKQIGLTNNINGSWYSYVAVPAGTQVYYLITIENIGDVPLSPVSVSDPNVNTSGCTWPNPLPVAVAANNNHIATCIVGPVTTLAGQHPNTATANGTYGGNQYTDTSTATYATTGLTIDKVANPTTFNAAGDTINYTFTVTNSGFATLSGPVTVDDNLATNETCPSLTTIGDNDDFFDPGEQIVCTASYTITATDVTNGSVTNTATASAGGVTSPSDSATVTLAGASADLQMTKDDGSTTYTSGGPITYTLVASNAGPNAVAGATVTDTLPAALTNAAWTCAAAGGASCTASGTGNINDTINLPVGGTATYTLTATVAAGTTGSLDNTVSITPPSGVTDPDTTNNTATDSDTSATGPAADLVVTKTDNQLTYTPGSPITYTIVVTNNGPSAATAATFADPVPASITGVIWTCAASAGSSCASGTGNGNNINTTLNLLVNGTATFTISGTVDPAATGNLDNTASVNPPTGTSDPNPANNSATDTDTPLSSGGSLDLAIAKTDNQTNYVPGGSLVYVIVATNNGPSPVTNAAVTDTFPPALQNVTWTCAPSAGSSCNVSSGSSDINTTVNLAVNGTATFTVNASVAAGTTGDLTNTVNAAPPAGMTDTNPANNTATDTDAPPGASVTDLAITKTDGVTNYTPGNALIYTIVVTNNGPSAVTGAAVTDNFPTSIVGATWTCAATNGSCAAPNGTGNISTTVDLAAGGTATFTVTAPVAAGTTGLLTNTASVSLPAGTTDSNPNNNTASDTDAPPGSTVADLSVTKTDNQPMYTAGGPITYVIVVTNRGPGDVTNATVTDTIPASIQNPTWTCAASAGSSCGAGSGTGSITTTVNLLGNNGTATFTVSGTVDSTLTGPLVNTVTVAPPGNVIDPTPADNTATDTDSTDADLSITKNDFRANYQPGGAISYAIVVINHGPSPVTNVTVTDFLPPTIQNPTWTCTASAGSSCGAPGGTGNIGASINLLANGTATFAVTGTVSSSITGDLVNTASVALPAGVNDPNPNDNTATDTDQPPAPPGAPAPAGAAGATGYADPAIVKLVDPALALPGETVNFVITVSNNGNIPAQNVVVVDRVPDTLQIVSVSEQQGTHTVSGNSVTFNVGTVNPNQPITLRIVARIRPDVTPPIDVNNVACLQGVNKCSTAALRIARGTLPATGEHPDDPPDSGWLWILMVPVALVLAALLIRRRGTVLWKA